MLVLVMDFYRFEAPLIGYLPIVIFLRFIYVLYPFILT